MLEDRDALHREKPQSRGRHPRGAGRGTGQPEGPVPSVPPMRRVKGECVTERGLTSDS